MQSMFKKIIFWAALDKHVPLSGSLFIVYARQHAIEHQPDIVQPKLESVWIIESS